MQPVFNSQTVSVISTQQELSAAKRERILKYEKIIRGFGITEIIFGAICIIFAVICIAIAPENYRDDFDYNYRCDGYGFSYISNGICCSVFIIVSGALGVSIRKNPTGCMITANLTMAIIASLAMSVSTIMAGLAATIYSSCINTAPVALHSMISIISFVGMIVTITHSAYCCATNCCIGSNFVQLPNGHMMPIKSVVMTGTQQQAIQYPTATVIPGAMLSNPNQQQIIVTKQGPTGHILYTQPSTSSAVVYPSSIDSPTNHRDWPPEYTVEAPNQSSC